MHFQNPIAPPLEMRDRVRNERRSRRLLMILTIFVGKRPAYRLLEALDAGYLPTVSVSDLIRLTGMDEVSARTLAFARELGIALLETPPPTGASLASQGLELLPARFAYGAGDTLLVFAFSEHARLLAIIPLSKANAPFAFPCASEVLIPLVRLGASRFAVAQNRAHGDPTPTEEDIAFTAGIVTAARVLDVHLLDHFIVVPGRFASFAALGLLAEAVKDEQAADAFHSTTH